MSKFVRIPKRGDIAANELKTDSLGNHKTVYIPREYYNAADIAGTHEVLGSVAGLIGREPVIVHPDCGTSSMWTKTLWWYCTGYTLDGTPHTINFSLYFASNSWNSPIAKNIPYTASSLSALISTLNTAFANDSDFIAQDWYADEYNGKLRLMCVNISWHHSAYNSASGGLTMGYCMPEITAHADMRRRHGGNGGDGAISSMARALIYYESSTGSAEYEGNRTSIQNSVKQTYPINLTTWNRTSPDYCAPLRAKYGEGRDGWLRFMKSCLPVTPTDYGDMGVHDGKSICNPLAQITGRTMSSATATQLMPAFAKPYNLMGNTFSKGDFWLPTTEEIAVILSGSNDSADPLNLGLTAIGGSIIPNSAHLWSCFRCVSYFAWYASGYRGFFRSSGFGGSFTVVPVSRSIL